LKSQDVYPKNGLDDQKSYTNIYHGGSHMGLSENLGKKPNPYGGSSFFQVTKAIWEYSPNIWKSPYIATAITIDNVRSRLELAMSPQWQYRNWNDHGPFRQP
jgi:hypothetical protein